MYYGSKKVLLKDSSNEATRRSSNSQSAGLDMWHQGAAQAPQAPQKEVSGQGTGEEHWFPLLQMVRLKMAPGLRETHTPKGLWIGTGRLQKVALIQAAALAPGFS